MLFLLLLIFIAFPILGLPIYLFFYFFDKDKKGILYSILIGLTLGLVSYYFVPKVGYDLVRHQKVLFEITGMSFSNFIRNISNFNLEIIPMIYSYIVSFFKNLDLLQFFIISTGYTIIFYILYDYRKRINMDLLPFFFITLFTFSGFQHLFFISGLYNYIAIIIFSLALYSEYVKGKDKKKCMIVYILTLFIHSSMFLPFGVLILYKIFREKLSLKLVLAAILIFLGSYVLVEQMNVLINNNITNNLLSMYKSYVTNDDHFKLIYSGKILFIELSKLIVILSVILLGEKDKNKKLNGYIVILAIMTLLMIFKTRVAIRYIMLVGIVGLVPLMDYFKYENRRTKIFMLILVGAIGAFYLIYYIYTFTNQNFGNLSDNFMYNIFRIFNKN